MCHKKTFKAVTANAKCQTDGPATGKAYTQTVQERHMLTTLAFQFTLTLILYCIVYASPHLWNQLPSSLRQPHCVHSPPGSPHPTHITSSQSSPSFSHLSRPPPFTPDLKLISFTNPFLHSHSYSFRTDFTDLNLYCIKGALALVVLVSFSGSVC